MNYRREIDGLRALAVVPVILFHAGFPAFSGGFVGVDVFFVISGYLIGGLLLDDLRKGRFRLLSFYERRARRILPALFFVMVTFLSIAYLVLLPAGLESYSKSFAAAALFVSNILFWTQTDYFGGAAEENLLLHTWSLSVEEQFYLVFPLLLALIWKSARSYLVAVLGALALGSLVLAEWQVSVQPSAAFYLAPARVWEFLAGVLVALLRHERRALRNGPLAAVGAALILLPVFLYDSTTHFPGLHALPPVVGTCLILAFADRGTAVHRLLSSRLPVAIGLISYSAYLWHQPIFAIRRAGWETAPTMGETLGLIGLVFVLSWASWKFVEQPFRRRGPDAILSSRGVFRASGLAILVGIAIGVVGNASQGLKDHYLTNRLTEEQARRASLIASVAQTDPRAGMIDNGVCTFWTETLSSEFADRFDSCISSMGEATVLIGDSHAMNLHNILAKAGIGPFFVSLARPGCRPHDEAQHCDHDALKTFLLERSDGIEQLFYHQSGAYFLPDPQGKVDSPAAFQVGTPFRVENASIGAVISYLESFGASFPVTWIGPFSEARVNYSAVEAVMAPLEFNPESLARFAALDSIIAEVAERKSVRYVSLQTALNTRADDLVIGDCLTFRDQDHFSTCGEDIAARRLAPELDGLLGGR